MKYFSSEHWVFDKRINLSNVITGLMIALSIILWAAQIEKRIAILEVEMKAYYEPLHRLSTNMNKLIENRNR
jgi:hypothetical protein